MDFWQIAVYLVLAAFLIFLRSAVLKAHKQKIIAIRLRSYIAYWRVMVLENDWFSIFYIGIAWNKEIVESLKNDGGIKEIGAIE